MLLDILHSGLVIGLLLERIHTENFLVPQRWFLHVCLDVAIARLRTSGCHTQRDDSIGLSREVEGRSDHSLELHHVGDEMVSWRDDEVCLGILCLDAPAHVGNAWSCVTTAGFQEDVSLGNIWKLLSNDIGIFL